MTALSNNYKQFLGDGSKDERGNTLEEFLLAYDPYKYKSPSVTADIVVLKETEGTSKDNNTGLQVLLVKRKNHPCIGWWALPGGFAEMEESLEESAKRELFEETKVTDVDMVQLHTWGDPDRDPRGRIITVSFLAYLEHDVTPEAGDDAKEAVFADIKKELLSTVCTKEAVRKEYKLTLTNAESGIQLEAVVEVRQAKRGIKHTTYRVLSNNGIAFDHPKVIMDALVKSEA